MAKFGRNLLCPCGSTKKYKNCCHDTVDWAQIYERKIDPIPYFSTRGRNLLFATRIMEALRLDKPRPDLTLKTFKESFTGNAVREINEAIIEFWPEDLDIARSLRNGSTEVSGLYVGDYDRQYISRGIVRHSIYANKIILVDPFVYPTSVREKYSALHNPGQHRSQTLKNVNFWLDILPWIQAGIVEVIRTPADFDLELNAAILKYQGKKFSDTPELKKALDITVKDQPPDGLRPRAG
jgi:hypothetical protein